MLSRSDVEGAPRTLNSPHSSIHPFPSARPPAASGRHSSHRSLGVSRFHGKMSPLGLKESHVYEGEFRVSFSGNAG